MVAIIYDCFAGASSVCGWEGLEVVGTFRHQLRGQCSPGHEDV